MIGFSEAIRSFYSQYANFSGRATRAEYWWVALYIFIVAVMLYLPATLLLEDNNSLGYVFMGLYGLFCLVNIIPGLAIAWRRLHDIGKGGGWYFITFVPLIGSIWLLVLLLKDSEPFPNRFGNPVQDYFGGYPNQYPPQTPPQFPNQNPNNQPPRF